jgi:WD40 repeat protein
VVALGGIGLLLLRPHPHTRADSNNLVGELSGPRASTAHPRLVRRRLATRGIPSGICSWIAWSPDARCLAASWNRYYAASGSQRCALRLWNVATGKQQQVLYAHDGQDGPVAWCPDGTRLASAGDHYTIRLWSVREARHLRTLRDDRVSEWPGFVQSLAWSPNSRWIATAPYAGHPGVQIWDPTSGRDVACIDQDEVVKAFAWSPDGKQLAAVDPKLVRVWDTLRGEKLRRLNHPDVYALSWSPDGKQIATVSADGIIGVWNLRTGRPIWSHVAHDEPLHLSFTPPRVDSIIWNPTAPLLATAGGDGTLRLRDACGGKELLAIGAVGQGFMRQYGKAVWRPIAWSPDGKQIACQGNRAGLWIWDLSF